MGNLYLGLVHHPVMNKKGEEVVTSVTNLDIHDIARSSKTFGVKNYFLITPLTEQHQIVDRILGHWGEDRSMAYNPDRANALEIVLRRDSIEDGVLAIEQLEGMRPKVIVTSAKKMGGELTHLEMKQRISLDNMPYFLLFGTGWGLSASVIESADFRLCPIIGASELGYNHLSVRSAVAIYLDRLTGSL